jgi:hypothetical protein
MNVLGQASSLPDTFNHSSLLANDLYQSTANGIPFAMIQYGVAAL